MVVNFKYLILLFIVALFCNNICIASSLKKDNIEESVNFLLSINDVRCDFDQLLYNEDGSLKEKSAGSIVVKKPDSILLVHKSNNMRLRIVSINGNVKIFDEDTLQTVYVENQYAELMQFFTTNLQPENLKLNNKHELCLQFENIGATWNACLKINEKRDSIRYLSLYKVDNNCLANKTVHNKAIKVKKDGNLDKCKNDVKVFDILFKKVCINCDVQDKEFYIKDRRLFNDEDLS